MKRFSMIFACLILTACGTTPDSIFQTTASSAESGSSSSSGGGLNEVCVPGKQEACACPGQKDGAQVCNAKGTGYNSCQCEMITSSTSMGSGGDNSTGSTSSSGMGGSTNSSSSDSGGAGGSCIPNTKHDTCVNKVCGVVPDGCNGTIDCENDCVANFGTDYICGGASPNQDGSPGTTNEPYDCVMACGPTPDNTNATCMGSPPLKLWTCSLPLSSSPKMGCTQDKNSLVVFVNFDDTSYWCCP